MRRREFFTALGGAAAWPMALRAQQQTKPVVGFLGLNSSAQMAPYTAWFMRGLNEAGFIDGQNVAIEYRWANGECERLPTLALQLVSDHAAVIFASGGIPPLRAAMAATRTIPIIFSLAGTLLGKASSQASIGQTATLPGSHLRPLRSAQSDWS